MDSRQRLPAILVGLGFPEFVALAVVGADAEQFAIGAVLVNKPAQVGRLWSSGPFR